MKFTDFDDKRFTSDHVVLGLSFEVLSRSINLNKKFRSATDRRPLKVIAYTDDQRRQHGRTNVSIAEKAYQLEHQGILFQYICVLTRANLK